MGNKNQRNSKPAKKLEPSSSLKYALLGGIIVITFWCYHYSLGNEFTTWDDTRIITQNAFIKSFSLYNLQKMLFHNVTGDYYNPVTIISYAVNYHFSGLSPQSYYLTNIIIHILNSCLVFFLVLMLLRAMEKNGYGTFNRKDWMAFFCSFAFAVHPMHVESVAWIAERKDVLYTFFYFAGLIAYVHFTQVKEGKYRWLILVFLCFLLSQFSKPVAIMFPFSLLAIDVLLKRDKTTSGKHIILEKAAFFLFSILFLITTYHSEKVSEAIGADQSYSFFQRFLFATYSFYIYIQKAFIPMPQSSFYPYPVLSLSSGKLPFIFYLSPFIDVCIIALTLYLSYKIMKRQGPGNETGKNNFRVALFGIAFYFFNMAMFSKIISSGPYYLADRYTYVCYLGIFFPVTYFVVKRMAGPLMKIITVTILSVYLLFLAVTCYHRTFVWHNTVSLWTDVAKKYPHRISMVYNDLGAWYLDHGDFDTAYSNLHEAIQLEINYPAPLRNMGLLMNTEGHYDSALYFFNGALREDSDFALVYLDRGIVYGETGRYNLAIKDFIHSFRLKPDSEAVFQNLAYAYLGKEEYDSAIIYYNYLVKLNPALYGYFQCRGLAELHKGQIIPAMNDFLHTLQLFPRDSESMYYLSLSYGQSKDFKNAYKYALLANGARYPIPAGYINSLKDSLSKE